MKATSLDFMVLFRRSTFPWKQDSFTKSMKQKQDNVNWKTTEGFYKKMHILNDQSSNKFGISCL